MKITQENADISKTQKRQYKNLSKYAECPQFAYIKAKKRSMQKQKKGLTMRIRLKDILRLPSQVKAIFIKNYGKFGYITEHSQILKFLPPSAKVSWAIFFKLDLHTVIIKDKMPESEIIIKQGRIKYLSNYLPDKKEWVTVIKNYKKETKNG